MTIVKYEQMDQLLVKCEKDQVLNALYILKELNKNFLKDEMKKQLLDEATNCSILLQITLKKIPHKNSSKRIKVPLPNSLVTDTTEVCLFVGDLEKNNKKAEVDPDVLHYKELLQRHGIDTVNEVITLRQLRTEYKVYETKRQLMAAYDIFLADRKIAQCLPKLLGKSFFKKRKFPIQINMESPNLKSQIEKALSATVFSVTCKGNTCTSEVARLGMGSEEIVENILASVEALANNLPGQQQNISGIYLKTPRSPAVPIFVSFGNPNEVKLQRPHNYEKIELEELSTLPDAEVKVFNSGRIVVKKTRPGIETDGESSNKLRHRKRKRVDARAVDQDVIEYGDLLYPKASIRPSETTMKKKRKFSDKKESCDLKKETKDGFLVEDDEAVYEDLEEDNLEVKSAAESNANISMSKSKSKKKHKANDKKQSQRDEESKELEASREITIPFRDESEVKDFEENTSKKTKLKNKHNKTNLDKGDQENENMESSSSIKLKSKQGKVHVNETQVVKESDESGSISNTKLKSKRKSNVEKMSREDRKSSETIEVDSNDEVEDAKDVGAGKTKIRNKRKSNVETNVAEEAKSSRKRKSTKILAGEDIVSIGQSALKENSTDDKESVQVLPKSQPRCYKRDVITEKRILRSRT